MNNHWYHCQENTLYLQLYLQTHARTDAIQGLLNNRLNVHINAPPVDGKANKHLLALLANEFGVSKSKVEIIHGKHGRNKSVVIHSPGKTSDWFFTLADKIPSNRIINYV